MKEDPRLKHIQLTYGQKALWNEYLLYPDSGIYNITYVWEAPGIDLDLFREILFEVARKFVTWNTVISVENGVPVLAFHDGLFKSLIVKSLAEDEVSDLDRIIQDQLIKRFDLFSESPVRWYLFERKPLKPVLVFQVSHIVADIVSVMAVLNDIRLLYVEKKQNFSTMNPQWFDVQFQEDYLQSEKAKQAQSFWLESIENPPLLNLQTDFPRAAGPVPSRGVRQFDIADGLLADARQLAKDIGISPFQLFLTAYHVLLFKLSGQADVITGVPASIRPESHPEIFSYFVNPLVVRSFYRDIDFTKFAQANVETIKEALSHRDYPFSLVAAQVDYERDMSRNPIFQCQFIYEDGNRFFNRDDPMISMDSGEEIWSVLPVPWRRVQVRVTIDIVDISLKLVNTASGFYGLVEYREDLYRPETALRIADSYLNLLRSIVENPKTPIRYLQTVDVETVLAMAGWNYVPQAVPRANLFRLVEDVAAAFPDAPAILFQDSRMDYAELNQLSDNLCYLLRQKGVVPGAVVGICMNRSPDLIVAILAILKCGAAFVSLDPKYPKDRLAFIVDDTKAGTVLCEQETLELCDGFASYPLPVGALTRQACEPFEKPEISPEYPAYFIYTSGSTGRPKGVSITHGNAISMLTWAKTIFGEDELECVLFSTSLNFDLSIFEIFLPLCTGHCMRVVQNALDLMDQRTSRITLLNTVPSVMKELVNEYAIPDSVITVNLAGEPLPKKLLKAIFDTTGVRHVYNLYGPSEDTTYSTFAHFEETPEWVSIGVPISNTHGYVLDRAGLMVPFGFPGELCLGGAGLSLGYLRRAGATAEKFTPDPFSLEPGERLYHTGDLVRYRDNKELDYIGRIDFQVKLRGFRIELGEIEDRLLQCEAVDQALVTVVDNAQGNPLLVAYIITNSAVSDDALETFLASHLPEYMIPQAFVKLDSFPLTPNKKIDRKALPAPDLSKIADGRAFAAPRTPTEELIAQAWSAVLGLDQVGVHDNFFKLGGHSLLATQVLARVRDALDRDLSLADFFHHPTVAGLADVVGGLGHSPIFQAPPVTPVPRDRDLPLSFPQHSLWFIDKMQPNNPVYNLFFSFRLEGPLDVRRLGEAIDRLVNRHEALRTIFPARDGNPVPSIQPAEVQGVLTVSRCEAGEVPDYVVSEGRRPFKLGTGPLYRFTLLQVSPECSHLLFNLHHIVSDGWSLNILIRELNVIYAALTADETPELPEVTVQFVDFAHWQRQWLRGEVLESRLGFWQTYLSGANHVLGFPSDHPRPMNVSYQGARYEVSLDEQRCQQLEQLSREANVTLFMTLLAAYGLLISRYSRQEDLLIGSPVAGRERTEVEQQVGFFVNSLVLRLRLEGNPRFLDYLHGVRESALSAFSHGDVPFDLVVDHLQPERDLSRNPLFQAMFNLQNKVMSSGDNGGLSFHPESYDTGVAHFDLTLNLEKTDRGYAGMLEYSTDLYQRATIERFANHFQTLLRHIVANPHQHIGRIDIMEADERERVLTAWNQTDQPYDPNLFLHHRVAQLGELHGDTPAVDDGTTRLTYRAFNHRANRLAHYLRGLGVGPGTIVGIAVRRDVDMIVAVFGVFKAGGAYVPLDPQSPRERLNHIIEDTGLTVIISQEENTELLPPHRARVVLMDSDGARIGQKPETTPLCSLLPLDLAYIIYTSGTTGKPKGVLLHHAGLTNLMTTHRYAYEVNETDRVLLFPSLNFDAAIFVICQTLAQGACLHVARKEELLGHNLGMLIQTRGITAMTCPPSVLPTLKPDELPSLRTLLVAGEACSPELAALWSQHCRMYNGYGPTETTVWGTCCRLDDSGSAPIGKPVANNKVYLLDRRMEPTPIGVGGELHLGSIGLARGYLNRPDLTAQQFVPNPFAEVPGERLYKTGDLARYREDGQIMFMGRIDHQVKIRGFRIELGEIESTLHEMDVVRDVLVIAREDRPGQKQLVAYVVREPGSNPDQREMRVFLAAKLPDYMVPAAFVVLDALPLTADGSKVDRRALPKPGRPSSDSAAQEHARSEVEEQIIAIWKALLQVHQVDVHDNFFDLGGHSLLLAQVQDRIKESFDRQVGITDLFQYPTVIALAEFLSPGHREKSRELHRNVRTQAAFEDIAVVGMSGRFPMSPNVDRFWENLRDGIHCISFFDDGTLIDAGVDPGDLNKPNYVKAAGYLDDSDLFDAAFFGITPREARIMDPQHRLFLEGAWHALEHAGYNPFTYPDRISLFAGMSMSTYLANNLYRNPALMESAGVMSVVMANDKDFMPTRVSYKLNLKGPAVNVQTACSTSLVAVHMACAALMAGECEMAMAGGVRVQVPRKSGYLYEEGGIVSPDGYCRAFDAKGMGMLGGSGYGIVVLKRLGDALTDNDTVHAVVKGTSINNDGNDKMGYTAPSISGQAEAIAQAMALGGVHPESVGYIEAHGTGTKLGDPIEIAALTQAFRGKTDKTGFCAIGSAKTNIGHLDAAAGIAGFIKAVLVLAHKEIPANLHFDKPNPEIDFDNSPFYVSRECHSFPRGETPRRAGVSSFGLGGTNAHIVLEEAPEQEPVVKDRSHLFLPVSGKTETALEAAIAQLKAHLERAPVAIEDAAFTMQVGRVAFKKRAFVVCSDGVDAIAALGDGNRLIKAEHPPEKQRVVFMFSGQGAQYVGMARDLYEGEPAFREQVDECCELLLPHLGLDLRELLYPETDDPDVLDMITERFNQTDITQPALFVISYCLAQQWMRWGIRADAMIGHSIGEFAAATLAGVFSLEDALALVVARGRLMQSQPSGDMLAVPMAEAELQAELVGRGVSLAAVNGPTRCVVSGPAEEIEALAEHFRAKDLACSLLHTSHAFHSTMMDDILAPFISAFKKVKMSPPNRPFVSNVTGKWITDEEAVSPRYWADHLRGTVRFAQGINLLLGEKGTHLFLEVGPGKTLVTFAGQMVSRGSKHGRVQSLRHPKAQVSDMAFFSEALGRLWLAGCEIDWSAYYQGRRRRRIPMPGYPFQRERFWVDPSRHENGSRSGTLQKRFNLDEWFYVPGWKRSPLIENSETKCAGHWLLFNDRFNLGEALARRLRRDGAEVDLVNMGNHYERTPGDEYILDPGRAEDYVALFTDLINRGRRPQNVLHLWNLTGAQTPIPSRKRYAQTCAERGFFSLMFLAQALEQLQVEDKIHIAMVTNGMREVHENELIFPEKATLLGATMVIPREFPDISCRTVDIVLPKLTNLDRLVNQLLSEMQAHHAETQVALRGRHRWVQTFEQIPLKARTSSLLKQGGTYLVTGGLSGVGLMMAKYLAKTYKARLVLTRRSLFPRREKWDQYLNVHGPENTLSRTIEQLREMERMGAAVLAVNGDVADREQMAAVLKEARKKFGKIDGVLHAAGLPPSGMFSEMTEEKASGVFLPKVMGTLVLAELFCESDLDFMLLFSSTSAILGNMGYGDYVAANAFLDAFAHQQSSLANRYTVAVNWDGWQEVGMAVENDASQAVLANAISNQEGVDALERILSSSGQSQVAVSTMDLNRMLDEIRQFLGAQANGDLADELERVHADEPEQSRLQADGDYAPPTTDIEQRVTAHWCEALGFDKVGRNDDFYELGGDSLLGTMLATKHRKVFKIKFGARLIAELPTVAQQAAYIEEHLAVSGKPKRPDYQDPESETQILLASHMGALLGEAKVGLADSFTAMGGNLAKAVTLAGRISDELGVPFTAEMVLEQPVVGEMADSIDTLLWATREISPSTSTDDTLEFEI